jgi:hypothetical protein
MRPVSSRGTAVPLSDAVIIAVGRLVDDAQVERREPSHSDLRFLFGQANLSEADLTTPAGKEKRVRHILSWALEHDEARGGRLVGGLIAAIRGFGGFRAESPNFVGQDAIKNAQAVFAAEGFELTEDGELRPALLQGIEDAATPTVLRSYVRRALRGSRDAALVMGTGKDLLEATAAHVLVARYGAYADTENFPTLLGQAFMAVGLTTPATARQPGEPAYAEVERRLFEAGCAVNRLRNKEGTGHGRPFPSTVSDSEARIATEVMGAVAQLLLDQLEGSPGESPVFVE